MGDLSEWAHGFIVGGMLGVVWGVMLTLFLIMGAAGHKNERQRADLPNNVVGIRKRKGRIASHMK